MQFDFNRDDYPEFMAEVDRLEALSAAGLEDSKEYSLALARMFELAPPEVRDASNAKLDELGLRPDPIGYTADGEPVYALSDMAARLGLTEEEALAILAEADGLHHAINPADVHRIQ